MVRPNSHGMRTLWTGHLMQKLAIDVYEGAAVVGPIYKVLLPNFIKKSVCHGHRKNR